MALALGVGACSSTGNQYPVYTSTTRQVAASEAFVVPPPGGPAIIAVLETLYSNAVEQEIALRTNTTNEGQNAIYAKVFGPVGGQYDPTERFTPTLPTQNRISNEMRAYLPGVPMKVSPYFAQNSYGPFGYAIGRAASGSLCIYGWQKIAPHTPRALLTPTRGAVDLRLRVCDLVASEDELLSLMYGLVIVGTVGAFGWNPFGDAPPMDANVGRAGYPIAPTTWPYVRPVAPAAPAVARPTRAVTAATTPPRSAKTRQQSEYPAVPDPSGKVSRPTSGIASGDSTKADPMMQGGEPIILVPPPSE